MRERKPEVDGNLAIPGPDAKIPFQPDQAWCEEQKSGWIDPD
jgi:hypothetical protein